MWNFFTHKIRNLSSLIPGCCFNETYEPKLTLPNDVTLTVSYRIEYILRLLLSINDTYSGIAIESLISSNCFPGLLLEAVCLPPSQSDSITLAYLKRLLLDNSGETRAWICSYLKKQPGSEVQLEMLNKFFMELCTRLISNASPVLTDSHLLDALTLLRVLATLRGFANYSFSPVLCAQLLTLLTHEVVDSDLGSQYTVYSLAFLIGLRGNLTTQQDTDINSDPAAHTENRIVAWLQRLIQRPSDKQSRSRTYVEPLILLAILFHTNQPGPITELISNLLGLRIPSLGRTVNAWRKVLLQSVFTEAMITRHAAQMSITPALSRKMSVNLPIHCMLQLLKSHAFAKHKLELKDWIIGQILESVRPLHPLLPDLIEAHVTQSLRATGSSGSDANFSTLISESDLLAHFSESDKIPMSQFCIPSVEATTFSTANHQFDSTRSDLTPSLLLLYYSLFVYDSQLASRIAANRHRSPGESTCVYSEHFWDRVPITYLLEYARGHLSDYSPLYPRLLQLVTNHFPHLTVGELMIHDELLLAPVWCCEHTDPSRINGFPGSLVEFASPKTDECFATYSVSQCICTPRELEEAFDAALLEVSTAITRTDLESEPVTLIPFVSCRHLIRLVQQISSASSTTAVLLPFGSVIGFKGVRFMLASQSHFLLRNNRRFLSILGNLWCRLHLVMPRRLDILSISALRESPISSVYSTTISPIKASKITGTDLKVDPVENIICGVNPAVFRCPPVLRIFMRILESNLLASRSYWTHRLLERVPTQSSAVSTVPSTDANSPVNPRPTFRSNINVSGNSLESPLVSQNQDTTTLQTTDRFVPFTDEECDRFCSNMLLTQSATVVQLLLERCLPTKNEMECSSEVTVLREIRNEICTYIHYMFIAEPALAEVIVWQTYPRSLLPVTAQAIPSLHICLDHVLHVFRNSGDYAKLVFCLDMVSNLSLHYNIQSAFERAAFMLDSLYHLLTVVISAEDRPNFLNSCLPALVRLGAAFPSLAPQIARLLLTVSALIVDTLPDESLTELRSQIHRDADTSTDDVSEQSNTVDGPLCVRNTMRTFSKLITCSSMQRILYYPPEPPIR